MKFRKATTFQVFRGASSRPPVPWSWQPPGRSLAAQAEGQISIAQQFGIGYLILDVVQDQKLIEKHGKALGVDVKVSGAKSRRNRDERGAAQPAMDVVSANVPCCSRCGTAPGRQNVKAVAAWARCPTT